jgi:hypothetical protein
MLDVERTEKMGAVEQFQILASTERLARNLTFNRTSRRSGSLIDDVRMRIAFYFFGLQAARHNISRSSEKIAISSLLELWSTWARKVGMHSGSDSNCAVDHVSHGFIARHEHDGSTIFQRLLRYSLAAHTRCSSG